jgi:hypothetical protein
VRTVSVTGDDLRARLIAMAEQKARRDVFAAAGALSHLVFQEEMTAPQARERLAALVSEACSRLLRDE